MSLNAKIVITIPSREMDSKTFSSLVRKVRLLIKEETGYNHVTEGELIEVPER